MWFRKYLYNSYHSHTKVQTHKQPIYIWNITKNGLLFCNLAISWKCFLFSPPSRSPFSNLLRNHAIANVFVHVIKWLKSFSNSACGWCRYFYKYHKCGLSPHTSHVLYCFKHRYQLNSHLQINYTQHSALILQLENHAYAKGVCFQWFKRKS